MNSWCTCKKVYKAEISAIRGGVYWINTGAWFWHWPDPCCIDKRYVVLLHECWESKKCSFWEQECWVRKSRNTFDFCLCSLRKADLKSWVILWPLLPNILKMLQATSHRRFFSSIFCVLNPSMEISSFKPNSVQLQEVLARKITAF